MEKFVSSITLGTNFKINGIAKAISFLCSPREPSGRGENPLYHTAGLFVKRKSAQILIYFYPKICAIFLKILLAFPLAIPYNNTCKEQTTIHKRR